MRERFDRRVVPDGVLALVRECQRRVEAHLGGGVSRSEPRDLVDLLFLDRAGFPPEEDFTLASRKDVGIGPGVLAWLPGQFPTSPLPVMLEPLTESDLRRFRDELRERIRGVAVPGA